MDKWYMDVTADDGSAAILYTARLRWDLLQLTWSSVLESRPGQPVRAASSVLAADDPVRDARSVRWRNGRLGVEAQYELLHPGVDRVLYETTGTAGRAASEDVVWHCISPLAKAQLTIGGRAIHGLGYVERLVMTVRPWELPIDTLRWGRFCSDNLSIAWIGWEGPRPLTVAVVNGQCAADARIDDRRVVVGGDTLELQVLRTLRDGPIAGTVLRSVARLLPVLPGGIADMVETKWLSAGHVAGHAGMAIHEAVQFGRRRR